MLKSLSVAATQQEADLWAAPASGVKTATEDPSLGALTVHM